MLMRKPAKINFGNKAFTLMEILVVVSLMSLVSIAIYSSLSIGLRVWKRSYGLVAVVRKCKSTAGISCAAGGYNVFKEERRAQVPDLCCTVCDNALRRGLVYDR